jgi:aspartyl-tRNA(Asn)/glutamyl-tRNA(Gln) amidotransferase subunit B
MKRIPVIGLEVHVVLNTTSKMFCSCRAAAGGEVNTRVCPVCLGHPGTLPAPNGAAVRQGILAAQSLNCRINSVSAFDRKNYSYPDLPKGYQVTQYFLPLAQGGYLEYIHNGDKRRLEVDHLHLEEDTGKSMNHDGTLHVDFNRAGIPLAEIVFAPVLHCPQEAKAAMEALHELLVWCGVTEGKMEEGHLRIDANLSLATPDNLLGGSRVELKNLNSFRVMELALAYEIARQGELLAVGQAVLRQARRWSEGQQVTEAMRVKETAGDYSYFPDPDLPRLQLDPGLVADVARELPEPPLAARQRLQGTWGLDQYMAGLITANRELLAWFEAAVNTGADPGVAANWLVGDVARYLKDSRQSIGQVSLSPLDFSRLLRMVDQGFLSNTAAKSVLRELMAQGGHAEQIAEGMGLLQLNDNLEIQKLVATVLADHPGAVADYKAGKDRALGFLVGQVMKLSQGRANPELVSEELLTRLN